MPAPKAKRYAQAVFDYAVEHDTLDEWASDLDTIAEALADPDYAALLEAPQVPRSVKLDGINTVLGSTSELARNLVRLLVDNGHPRLAMRVRDEYRRMMDAHQGIARAEIVTAVPVDDSQRQAIVSRLSNITNKDIVPTWREDPHIIGGLVARVDDTLFDGSVRAKLEALKERLARPVAQRGSASDDGQSA
ncbi:MAG: F0F1 ATP synthase subunit delta [Chloroflexota bacterium]